MHQNSLESYREGTKGAFKTRSQAIFNTFYFGRKELTDREVLRALFPGSDDLNKIRPRVTELTKNGVLEEAGERLEGSLRVRVSRVKFPQTDIQMDLL